MSARNVFISLLTVIIAFSVLISCKETGSSSTATVSLKNSGAQSRTAPVMSDKELFDTASITSYHPISDDIDKTFYQDNLNAYSSHKITASYDFDGDSADEDFTVDYQYSKNGSLATEISIGKATIETHFLGLCGVYAIHINKELSEKYLALVEYDSGNYIYTHFYKYKKTAEQENIIDLGQLDGSVTLNTAIQTHSEEFNEVIMSDSKGKLIPRFSLIKYLTPSIILNVYSLDNESILRSSHDNSDITSKDYTVSFDTSPYFEQGNMNSSTYIPKANKSDKINLKMGDKIQLLSISNKITNQEVAVVRLENGKQGLLYYFINPY